MHQTMLDSNLQQSHIVGGKEEGMTQVSNLSGLCFPAKNEKEADQHQHITHHYYGQLHADKTKKPLRMAI